MKCNYPGAYKHNKMTIEERKEFESKVLAHLASKGIPFLRIPGMKNCNTSLK